MEKQGTKLRIDTDKVSHCHKLCFNIETRPTANYPGRKALQKGKNLKDMTLAEMDAIWEEAKKQEKEEGGFCRQTCICQMKKKNSF